MASILRAGPFASSTDSFLNEPGTPTDLTVPVNCAMSDWVNHSWKAFKRIETDGFSFSYVDGPTVGASWSVEDIIASGFMSFMYQAAVDTTFNLSYSITGDGIQGASISVSVDGSFVFFDSDDGSPASVSGTETIDLPATVVPILVFISGTSALSGGGSFTVSPS